jgi:predicted Zn finger-like uncharacterized protein
MILVCPNCAARYEVDGSKFPAEGRKVRCKKCGHVWHQSAQTHDDERAEIEAAVFDGKAPEPEPEPEVVLPHEPELEPEPEVAHAWRAPQPDADEEYVEAPVAKPGAPSARGGILIALGWVAFVGVLLVIGFAAASYRTQIVSAWPKSASLFSHLGMGVNGRGLEFADVQHANQTEDRQPVLVITGRLVNVSGKTQNVPSLRVELRDGNKHHIYDWTFHPSEASLAPGQSVKFRTRLSNPPSATHLVEIHFADGAE